MEHCCYKLHNSYQSHICLLQQFQSDVTVRLSLQNQFLNLPVATVAEQGRFGWVDNPSWRQCPQELSFIQALLLKYLFTKSVTKFKLNL